jgi:hypothetical protein
LSGSSGSQAGYSCALSSTGTTVAVGSQYFNSNKGRVQIYDYIGSSWVQRSQDLTGSTNSEAGTSCALSSTGTIVAVGSRSFNGGFSDQGRVQVYGLDSLNISSFGNSNFIGINNPNPTAALDVSGAVNISSATASTSTSTGALIVAGGVGIGGAVNTSGAVNISSATASTSTSTGAVKVTGGVGIGGNVFVGGNLAVTGTASFSGLSNFTLSPTGPTDAADVSSNKLATRADLRSAINTLDTGLVHITGAESISGIKTFTDTTASTSTSTGALVVTGGVGIGGNVFVGGNLFSTTINTDSSSNVINLYDITSTGNINLATATKIGGAQRINIGNATNGNIFIGGSRFSGTTGAITTLTSSTVSSSTVNTNTVSASNAGTAVVLYNSQNTGNITMGSALTSGSINIGTGTAWTTGNINICTGTAGGTTNIGRSNAIQIANGASTTVNISPSGLLTLGGSSITVNSATNFTVGPTAPTATAGVSSLELANTTFVRNEIALLVDSAPAALNTLNELAAALGDDENFSTTITNSLASKANTADVVTLTGSQTVTGAKTFTDISVNNTTSINSIVVAGNSTVGGKGTFGEPPSSALYEFDVSGQMRIYETTGSVGGSSTGSLVLEHGDASGASSIVFKSTNNSGSDYAYIQYQENVGGPLEKGLLTIGIENDTSGNTADRISLFAAGGSGFVGVNTKNPSAHLDVSGNVNATSYNATSDYRIKENVTPLDLSFNVDVLKPVSYNLKGNDSHLHVGFIAHEVQEFFPFLVNGVKDGPETQSVNYNGFIGIITKEIQVLKKKDEENRAKLDAQESRIQCLEELVSNLTKP